MTLEQVIAALETHGYRPRKSGQGYEARCPGHDDNHASLSIGSGDDGRVLLCCHAGSGCELDSIISPLGLSPRDLFEDSKANGNGHRNRDFIKRYVYTDEAGQPLHGTIRFSPKGFSQCSPDGKGGWKTGLNGARLVVYNLPNVIKAVKEGIEIAFVEGEQDVDAVNEAGGVATCNPMGAGKYKAEFSEYFRGAIVKVITDKDTAKEKFAGQRHALDVYRSLKGIAASVQIVEAAQGKDATDHLAAGFTLDQFIPRTEADLEALIRTEPETKKKKVAESTLDLSSEFHLTDLGNAQQFIGDHLAKVRFVHGRRRWMTWTGTHWAWDESAEIMRLARHTVRQMFERAMATKDEETRKRLLKHAFASEAGRKLSEMVNLAASDEAVSITADALSPDPWLLNTQNGTLNLSTGSLYRHDPADYLTHCLPVSYDPDAKCPLWERFLLHVLAGDTDLIAFLQRAVGYTLTGSTREQCFFLLYGTGSNGKSTFLEVLRSLLAELAVHADFTTFLQRDRNGPRNDIARLRGARMVTAVEAEGEKRFAEAVLKYLTGGDTVSARFLYAEDFEFKPTFKLWLGTNHRPIIRGTDLAIWRRVKLIPFTVTVTEDNQDPDLADKLRAELDGILTWAVKGCQEWIKGRLGKAAAVTDATASYRSDMDAVAPFFEERCAFGRSMQVKSGDLFRAYKDWAERNGGPPLSQRALATYLQERPEKVKPGKVEGGRGWHGVGLQEQSGTDGTDGTAFPESPL